MAMSLFESFFLSQEDRESICKESVISWKTLHWFFLCKSVRSFTPHSINCSGFWPPSLWAAGFHFLPCASGTSKLDSQFHPVPCFLFQPNKCSSLDPSHGLSSVSCICSLLSQLEKATPQPKTSALQLDVQVFMKLQASNQTWHLSSSPTHLHPQDVILPAGWAFCRSPRALEDASLSPVVLFLEMGRRGSD